METTKTLGPGRFSYTYVWKPKANDDGTQKYSTAFLWPKSDTKTTKMVQDAMKAAILADEKGKKKLKGKRTGIKLPLRDGDKEREGDGAYEGMYFITANSDTQPGIVGEDGEPIKDQRDFYSGCKGYISVSFYAFGAKGNLGIAVGLNHVMKSDDDEALSGGPSAKKAFEGVKKKKKAKTKSEDFSIEDDDDLSFDTEEDDFSFDTEENDFSL